MSALLGLYLVAAALLVGAGAAKATRPRDTARSLAELRAGGSLPGLVPLVRAVAAAEALLGAVAVAVPDRPAAGAMAVSYVGFSGFVLYARARGGSLATCGCFGAPDTPPTITHAVINLILAVSAAGYGVARSRPEVLGTVLGHQYGAGIPLVAAAGLCAWLAYLAMSPLSRLTALRRS